MALTGLLGPVLSKVKTLGPLNRTLWLAASMITRATWKNLEEKIVSLEWKTENWCHGHPVWSLDPLDNNCISLKNLTYHSVEKSQKISYHNVHCDWRELFELRYLNFCAKNIKMSDSRRSDRQNETRDNFCDFRTLWDLPQATCTLLRPRPRLHQRLSSLWWPLCPRRSWPRWDFGGRNNA